LESPVLTRALTRSFGERKALDAVDLEVREGQFFALLGPNGGGKSTTFRILSTLLEPSGGEARVFGHDVVRDQNEVRKRIGVVFQRPSLDEKLRVAENLHYQGRLYGLRGAALKERIALLLDRFGLTERAEDTVKTLSGGLQRRVEIAKGMIHSPRLLLLDEPSTGLDPAARRELRENLERARAEEGVTIVMTTHILEEAEHCDAVTILDHGKVIASGSPEGLKGEISGDVLTIECEDPLALAPRLSAELSVEARSVGGALHVATNEAFALAQRVHEGFGELVRGVAITRPSLEDVFLAKTGHAFEADGGDEETGR
jgi:ABC-2 type transport system ATP-binding protein